MPQEGEMRLIDLLDALFYSPKRGVYYLFKRYAEKTAEEIEKTRLLFLELLIDRSSVVAPTSNKKTNWSYMPLHQPRCRHQIRAPGEAHINGPFMRVIFIEI